MTFKGYRGFGSLHRVLLAGNGPLIAALAVAGLSCSLDARAAIVAPASLAASAVSCSRIDLAWQDQSANETGFQIQRSLSSGSGFSNIASVGSNASAYSDTSGLACSTTYYYRVRAVGKRGGMSAYSNVASARTR
jgi:predicted phage tail protein